MWYVRAANAGSTDAMVRAGLLYWQGHPTEQQYQTAADWFRRAADKGDATGAGELSLLMAFGQGMPQDLDAALTLARKAEAGGHPEFLARLAGLYLDGWRSVPKDPARGTALLREAADHGDAASKARLAGAAPPASQPSASAALVPLKAPGL